jgi:hypothetical protein
MVELADWEVNNAHRIPKQDAEGLGRRKLPVVAG